MKNTEIILDIIEDLLNIVKNHESRLKELEEYEEAISDFDTSGFPCCGGGENCCQSG